MKTLFLAGFVLVAAQLVSAASIENARVTLTGADTYKIEFQASADSGDVAVFASSRPDAIDTARPVLEKAASPATVNVASDKRVYFHLKPRTGPTRVVATRTLPLEGGINFRDLGGYRTADGRHVKWGAIYRSAKLDQLTEKDFVYMSSLGLKLICDFRMEAERNRALTVWKGAGQPQIFFNPIDTPSGGRLYTQAVQEGRAAPIPEGGQAPRGTAAIYRWMGIGGLTEFGTLMRRIADGEVPMLFHCQEGRGRTGVFAALLLACLGVPRETIMEDFLLTNDLLLTPEALARMVNTNGRGGQSLEQIRRGLEVTPELINGTFAEIDADFPNMDAFMRDGLKMSATQVAALKSRLIEP